MLSTTESLLRPGLGEHGNWWKDDPLPTDPEAAFQWSALYTQAIDDAAVTLFAPLPIRAPTGAALAAAHLALQCNGSCSLRDRAASPGQDDALQVV